MVDYNTAPTANSNGDKVDTGGLATMTNQDVRNAFVMPNQTGLAAVIGNTPINNQAKANQAVSPLAGLTTLPKAALAGTAQAGLTQAGLNTAGPTTINTAQSNPLLQGQITDINRLNQIAEGQGPSLAGIQARQVADQNIASQAAMMGSQRGASNSGLGMRQAMQAKALSDQQAVQQSVQGRVAEEMAARQQLTAALGGTQGQVMQGNQAQAQLGQQTSLANQQAGNQVGLANAAASNQIGLANAAATNAQNATNAGAANQNILQQGSMNQQTAMTNVQNQAQIALANLQAKQQSQGLDAQEYNDMVQAQMALSSNVLTSNENYVNAMINQNLVQAGLNQGQAINSANNNMGLMGAGIGAAAALGAGALGAMSDKNLKFNITSGKRSIKQFLSQVSI